MSSNKSIARENIRSIIKIVDTRNLSYEEREQHYENWWTGLKDKC